MWSTIFNIQTHILSVLRQQPLNYYWYEQQALYENTILENIVKELNVLLTLYRNISV
jgi:hypothetical protein